jgi:MFS family permease
MFTSSFVPVLIGTVVIGLSQAFLLQSTNIVANRWFPNGERAQAQAILGLGVAVGSLLSFIVTGVLFAGEGIDYEARLNDLLFWQACVITVVLVFFIATSREKPEYPPSAVALKKPPKQDFNKAMSELWDNRSYSIIVICFMCIFGIQGGIGNLLAGILSPFGFSESQIAAVGALFLTIGIVGTLFLGKILDATNQYKKALVFIKTFE